MIKTTLRINNPCPKYKKKQLEIASKYTEKWGFEVDIMNVMRIMYLEKNMGYRGVGAELGISLGTVYNWFLQFGIMARKMRF